MTTFSYSSGNPANLTGGHAASMSDISGPLTDIPTFLNGSIDTTNLATSAKPVTLLGAYHTVAEATLALAGASAATVWLPSLGGNLRTGQADASSTNPPVLITLTATDYAVSGLTTKLRVVVSTAINATAPAVNFTFGLYPVTVAGGANLLAVTTGTVVSGSTVTRTTPSASTAYQDASSDFTAPAAGVYALGVSNSGSTAVSSFTSMTIRLERHHV